MTIYKMLLEYDNDYSFPEVMAMARERKGVTGRVVAENTGLSGPLIAQIEKGRVISPRFITVAKLAEYYNIQLDLLSKYALKDE